MAEPTFRPSNFMLIPTAACQSSCVYCFGPNRGETMSVKTADRALKFMARIAPERGIVNITFHGGEPLLAGEGYYEYILPRLTKLFGRRLRLSMQSNLLTMNEHMVGLIRDYRIAIGTSVDGDEELCDAQRGDGYYTANKRGQSLLRQNGVDVTPICTLTHTFANEAEHVFNHFGGTPYSLHGAVRALLKEPNNYTVTVEDMRRILLDTLLIYRKNIKNTRALTIDTMVKSCFDGQGHVCTFFSCLGKFAAIAPDGRVYSCQRFCGNFEYAFGNVLEDLTEENILNSAAYKLLYNKQISAKQACGDCTHFAYCSGGCLYNMFAADTLKDPYCKAYRAVFDVISHDMALEMGGLMTGSITPESAVLLQMAGDQPHPYDTAIHEQHMQKVINYGRYPLGASKSLIEYKRNRVQELNKLYLHITFDCPLRCDHCYAFGGETNIREMPANAVLDIIAQAQKALFRSVVITGGEPLIHSVTDKLLANLKTFDTKGMRLILRTSLGFPIANETLKMICEVFPEIVVSIDGSEQSHDLRRGFGRYKQTVSNLELIKEMGFIDHISVCATISGAQRNGADGEAVRNLCKMLGIAKIRFNPVLPLGRANGVISTEEFTCMDEDEKSRSTRPRFTCGLGQNLYIEPDGGVYPCYAWCGADKLLGNLLSQSLSSILNSAAFKDLSCHDVDTNEKCRTCEVRYLCGGMCKAWAFDKQNIDSGDFDCTARKAEYKKYIKSQFEGGTVNGITYTMDGQK